MFAGSPASIEEDTRQKVNGHESKNYRGRPRSVCVWLASANRELGFRDFLEAVPVRNLPYDDSAFT